MRKTQFQIRDYLYNNNAFYGIKFHSQWSLFRWSSRRPFSSTGRQAWRTIKYEKRSNRIGSRSMALSVIDRSDLYFALCASRIPSMIFIGHFIDRPWSLLPHRCKCIACAGNVYLNRSWEGRIPRSRGFAILEVISLHCDVFYMTRSVCVIRVTWSEISWNIIPPNSDTHCITWITIDNLILHTTMRKFLK